MSWQVDHRALQHSSDWDCRENQTMSRTSPLKAPLRSVMQSRLPHVSRLCPACVCMFVVQIPGLRLTLH